MILLRVSVWDRKIDCVVSFIALSVSNEIIYCRYRTSLTMMSISIPFVVLIASTLGVYTIALKTQLTMSVSLTKIQQGHIRELLSNPKTPALIRLKTKNIVFEKYHTWAHGECRRLLNKHGCHEIPSELYEYASHGLLRAIHRYDWRRNTSFSIYAKKYVMGSIYRGMNVIYRTRNHVKFVDSTADWIFDKYGKKYYYQTPTPTALSTKDNEPVDLQELLKTLTPDERHLFQYVYGHLFDGSAKKRTVKEICDLMAYGNGETYRIQKNRMMDKMRETHEDEDMYLQ